MDSMFYLYRSRDLDRYLSPGEFQCILTPAKSLKEARIHYDLSSKTNGWSLQFGVPPRKHGVSPHTQPYTRNSSGYADPIYDEVEQELQMGWLVGVDHGKRWDRIRNPFHIDEDGMSQFVYNLKDNSFQIRDKASKDYVIGEYGTFCDMLSALIETVK